MAADITLLAFAFAFAFVAVVTIAVGIDASHRGMHAGAWAAGVFLLLIVFLPLYLIVRKPRVPASRVCPACGEDVRRGLTVCEACGHDFAAAARAGRPAPLP